MNLDGLKDTVIDLMAGGSAEVRINNFDNDLNSFRNANEIFTLLVHLGYLYYDSYTKLVRIPNMEVGEVFIDSIDTTDWSEVSRSILASEKLLKAIWRKDNEWVANAIDEAHQDVALLDYNKESALSYTLGLALYYAKSYYTVIRELPSGKGYIDIAYIPRPAHADKPAMLVELKYNKSPEGAIAQIKAKNYPKILEDYKDKLLLVAINYDKDTKKHECIIE
jgi:hypothetical protein